MNSIPSSEHGQDRGPRGGGRMRGRGARPRAARRLPPVGGQLGTEAEDTRVLQTDRDPLVRLQARHVTLQP